MKVGCIFADLPSASFSCAAGSCSCSIYLTNILYSRSRRSNGEVGGELCLFLKTSQVDGPRFDPGRVTR